jgi:hypothetical protein
MPLHHHVRKHTDYKFKNIDVSNHADSIFTNLNMPPCNVVDISSSGSYTIHLMSWRIHRPEPCGLSNRHAYAVLHESSMKPLSPNQNGPSTQNPIWQIVFPVGKYLLFTPIRISWLASFGKKTAILLLEALLSILATRDVFYSSYLRQSSVFNE